MTQPDQPSTVAVAWIGRYRRGLLIAGPVLVALVILAFYLAGGRYVSTDDAYVQSARVDISANISERLKAIYVHDNQPVKAGAVLFALDPSRLEVAVQEAEAQLAAARLKVQTLQATYQERLADQAAAQDTLAFQQKDYDRQVKLADAKKREQSLAARRTTAGNRLMVREKLHDDRINDAFFRFEQAERSLDHLEGRVEAFDLGRGKSAAPTLEDELAALEANDAVDAELAALKARMGNSLPAGEASPGEKKE